MKLTKINIILLVLVAALYELYIQSVTEKNEYEITMITHHFALNKGIKKQELQKHTHKKRKRKNIKIHYTTSIFLITFKIIIKILNFLVE